MTRLLLLAALCGTAVGTWSTSSPTAGHGSWASPRWPILSRLFGEDFTSRYRPAQPPGDDRGGGEVGGAETPAVDRSLLRSSRARGEVRLHLLASGILEVSWVANQMGDELGLISGTAALVRKLE